MRMRMDGGDGTEGQEGTEEQKTRRIEVKGREASKDKV
jgi:hypothetical protein